jgi:hypothetical protein
MLPGERRGGAGCRAGKGGWLGLASGAARSWAIQRRAQDADLTRLDHR